MYLKLMRLGLMMPLLRSLSQIRNLMVEKVMVKVRVELVMLQTPAPAKLIQQWI